MLNSLALLVVLLVQVRVKPTFASPCSDGSSDFCPNPPILSNVQVTGPLMLTLSWVTNKIDIAQELSCTALVIDTDSYPKYFPVQSNTLYTFTSKSGGNLRLGKEPLFKGLQVGRTYQFSAFCSNSTGDSENADPLFGTAISVPGVPSNTRLCSVSKIKNGALNSNESRLMWSAPSDNGAGTLSFRQQYKIYPFIMDLPLTYYVYLSDGPVINADATSYFINSGV
jgi:hypothetical protein